MSFGPSPDELYHHRHVFEVIDRPRRILLASTETRLDGSSFGTTLEFTFEPRGGGTLMTMVHAGFPSEELRDEHTLGLPHAFDRLERALPALSREETTMSSSVLYMSMSLDGFITGPDDDADQGLGRGGERLHDVARRPATTSPPAFRPVGAERRGLRRGDGDRGGARRPPHVRPRRPLGRRSPRRSDLRAHARDAARAGRPSSVHYVTDGVESAMRQAKEAAGDATCSSTAPTSRSRACARACSTSSRST